MVTEAKKFATYDDILALPENLVGEIIYGELIVSPRPSLGHARSSSALGGEIFNPFDRGINGPGGWWILDEPELHLGSDILVPDLAGWRKEIVPKLPNKPYFDVAPQWVCEVLSKSTAAVDRRKKLPIYLREKVNHVWFINPEQKTLDIYLMENGKWILLKSFAGDELIRAEPFDAIELDLSSLWLPDDEIVSQT